VTTARDPGIGRLPGGVDGLDMITHGGLPENRLTLVAGTAGSAKTLFAVQFLAEGILRDGAPGVFVTFEERPEGTRRNVRSLGIDIAAWEEEALWRFVDASPRFTHDVVIVGRYDLSALLERVRRAVDEIGATRVAIDSVGALIAQFEDAGPPRQALFQLTAELEELGVTTVMTAERPDDYGPVSRHGFEEFVADNVVLLRNALEGERRRRTIEVLKLRGGSHMRGEHLFTVRPDRGVVIVAQESVDLDVEHESSTRRLPSGNERLDTMLDGGLLGRSLILVSGPTGAGKSLLATQFIAGGVRVGERGLLLSFEESRAQVRRNAAAWGVDFAGWETEDRLRLVCHTPESASLEDHLLYIKSVIDEFGPDRVAIDSLTALQRISTSRNFREYLLGLTMHMKEKGLLGLMTTAVTNFSQEVSPADLNMSTTCDTIIVLRYVNVGHETRRGLSVLKMRGSDHDKAQREYRIASDGMHIGEPLTLPA
jgi:circadian clock protein KaiC